MAGELSGAELKQARAELDKLNAQHGFRRNDGGRPPDSPVPSTPAEVQDEGSSASPGPPQINPEPARFIGVDLEHKLAGLSGGGYIPVADGAAGEIVDILIEQLKLHLTRTVGTIAESHGRPASDQLDLFKDQPANGTP